MFQAIRAVDLPHFTILMFKASAERAEGYGGRMVIQREVLLSLDKVDTRAIYTGRHTEHAFVCLLLYPYTHAFVLVKPGHIGLVTAYEQTLFKLPVVTLGIRLHLTSLSPCTALQKRKPVYIEIACNIAREPIHAPVPFGRHLAEFSSRYPCCARP